MRTVLAIENSNPSAGPAEVCIARVEGGDCRVIGLHRIDASDRGADGVMHAVDHAARAAGVTPKDIDTVAVSVGPGGYTALRIATATAKTLAWAIGAAVVPVPTALVAARGIAERPALIALACKKGRAHLTLIGESGPEDLGVCGPERLRPGLAAVICDDGHLPDAMAEHAAAAGIARRPLVLTARACAEAALGREPVDPVRLGPLYAREPDAVTQWRARHG